MDETSTFEREDDLHDAIARELYPEHKERAIGEFTKERLRAYYKGNPRVMRPAVDAIQEGKRLAENGHHSAALVFFVTAIELLLKATVLKPVVHGLVHNTALADIIVEQALGQTGFDRYTKLLSKLYVELAAIDINAITRPASNKKLLTECETLQRERNKIIHQGATCAPDLAQEGLHVAVAVYEQIVRHMLHALGLTVIEEGTIVLAQFRAKPA